VKRIRYLGVALIAALSLLAILGSASAGASWIVSSGTIKAASSGLQEFDAPGTGSFRCGTGPSFEVAPTATKSLDSGTLGNYTKCVLFEATTLKTNGCHLIFRPGNEIKAGVFGGTFEIGPAGCGPMSIEYLGGCKELFKSKAGLSAEYTNSGSGTGASVTVKLKATGLDTTGSNCGGGGTSANYNGTYVLTSALGVHVSEVKFFVDGEESKEESKKPKFNAGVYPSTIDASLIAPMEIKTPEGIVKCSSASLLSPMSTSTNTVDFKGTLTCDYAFGSSSTTKVNGCYFRFQVLTSSGGYGGKSSIVCNNPGEAIEVSPLFFGSPVCTISFPAQEIDSTTSFVNWENGIFAQVDGEGLTHTGTGGTCGSGTQSDAKLNTTTFRFGPGYS